MAGKGGSWTFGTAHKKLCGSTSNITRTPSRFFTRAPHSFAAAWIGAFFAALTSMRTRALPRTRGIGAGAGPRISAPIEVLSRMIWDSLRWLTNWTIAGGR